MLLIAGFTKKQTMEKLIKKDCRRLSIALLAWCWLFTGCAKTYDLIVKVPTSPFPISNDSFSAKTLADGFIIPFGIAVINDDEYLITDRAGKLFHYKQNKLAEVSGTPKVQTFGDPGLPPAIHGGLMDISAHPRYPAAPWFYVAYLGEDACARVSRFKLDNNSVTQFETIFKTRTPGHYANGMRIVWQDNTHFFLNVGGTTLSKNTDPVVYIAQDFNEDWGKIHRLNEDGTIPADNPVLTGMTTPSSIWSYGHRDSQGLYYDKATNTLFGAEHGPQGGDEFNIIKPGGNYGWPLFTYGIDYNGATIASISESLAATSSILPEHQWTVQTDKGGRSIAPACLLRVTNSNIAAWNDYFLIGSLSFRRLMKYNRATQETVGLPIEGRVRDVKQLPGGDIIVLIERNDLSKQNGKIVRISK